jgi:hypothetical protein
MKRPHVLAQVLRISPVELDAGANDSSGILNDMYLDSSRMLQEVLYLYSEDLYTRAMARRCKIGTSHGEACCSSSTMTPFFSCA